MAAIFSGSVRTTWKYCVGKKLGATVVEPLGAGQGLALGTMPISATAIRDTLMAALIALLDMTAKRGGPTEFDRGHDASLRRA